MSKEDLYNELDGISEILYGLAANAGDESRQNALIVLGSHVADLKEKISDETME